MSDVGTITGGGALALLVIREVLSFLKGQHSKGNGVSGDRTVEFWREEIRKLIEVVMDRRKAVIKEIVDESLDDFRMNLTEAVENRVEALLRRRGL